MGNILLGIWLGSGVANFIVASIYGKAIYNKAKREGYEFVKKKNSFSEKLAGHLKTLFLNFLPVVNTISVVVLLAKGFDGNLYNEFLRKGIKSGAIRKVNDDRQPIRGTAAQSKTVVNQHARSNVQRQPLASQPVRNAGQNQPVVNQPVRSVTYNKPVESKTSFSTGAKIDAQMINDRNCSGVNFADAEIVGSFNNCTIEEGANFKSYESMNIQEKRACLEAERLRAKSFQKNSDDFSRRL